MVVSIFKLAVMEALMLLLPDMIIKRKRERENGSKSPLEQKKFHQPKGLRELPSSSSSPFLDVGLSGKKKKNGQCSTFLFSEVL